MTINFSLFRALSNKDLFQQKAEVTRRLALNLRFSVDETDDETRACEYVFEATNAPREILDIEQCWIGDRFADAREHSVSVGDVLMINNTAYMCKSAGWEKIENFTANHNND
jgi:hypothetical protein